MILVPKESIVPHLGIYVTFCQEWRFHWLEPAYSQMRLTING